MGATGDKFYAEELVNGLNDESRESRLAAIQAVGMVRSELAVMQLIDVINNSDYQDERLAATMSLGFIGDSKAIPKLNELLEDDEPNIRWDSAIALAKMGEKSSIPVIENLMDRDYLMTFPQLDYKEINKVIMTAIETSSLVVDNRFEPKLMELAKTDENLTVRDAAIKTLKRSYDRII
jgi:HEAT repeat protein